MKRKIRLTESDLHDIIKESVKRVLNEGKVVNNRPIFNYNSYNKAKPGKKVDVFHFTDGSEFAPSPRDDYYQLFGYKDRKDFYNEPDDDKFDRIKTNFKDGTFKHNERARTKYDEKGNPMFGDEYYNKQFNKDKKENRKELKRFLRMLRLNKISKEDFNNSSKEEQEAYWNKLYAQERDEEDKWRKEQAYWKNVMDMKYGSDGW